MADYHVGCGLAGIYAGTLKKSGKEWLHKTEVTREALDSVVNYMFLQIPKDENTLAYGFQMYDGRYIRLSVEVFNERPKWTNDDRRI